MHVLLPLLWLLQAIRCTQEVAWALQQQQQQQQAPDNSSSSLGPDFHAACAWLMDQLLLHHLEVCFGVQMAVVVGCCVYVAAKVLQAPVSFSSLTQVSRTGQAVTLGVLVGWVGSTIVPPARTCA
jgi:hypothetical protein